MTILQERVPEAMRGQVFGSLMALSSGPRSLGVLVHGVMLERLGPRERLIVISAVNVAVPLMFWIAPLLERERVPVASRP